MLCFMYVVILFFDEESFACDISWISNAIALFNVPVDTIF